MHSWKTKNEKKKFERHIWNKSLNKKRIRKQCFWTTKWKTIQTKMKTQKIKTNQTNKKQTKTVFKFSKNVFQLFSIFQKNKKSKNKTSFQDCWPGHLIGDHRAYPPLPLPMVPARFVKFGARGRHASCNTLQNYRLNNFHTENTIKQNRLLCPGCARFC